MMKLTKAQAIKRLKALGVTEIEPDGKFLIRAAINGSRGLFDPRDLLAELEADAALPSILTAIARVSTAADVSGLPQRPYAVYVSGYGWAMDSVAAGSDANGRWSERYPDSAGRRHIYSVSVLPTDYFRR